jgi:hypothetical protein
MVLKNYDNLYFSFHGIKSFIKLKKDHITDFKILLTLPLLADVAMLEINKNLELKNYDKHLSISNA